MAINQAKARQYPEAKLLQFENYSLSSSMLSSETNRTYSKKTVRETRVSVMKMRIKIKNRSHRYDINRTRSRHEKVKQN